MEAGVAEVIVRLSVSDSAGQRNPIRSNLFHCPSLQNRSMYVLLMPVLSGRSADGCNAAMSEV